MTYRFCGSEERRSSDVAEMQRLVQQVVAPNGSLLTNLEGWSGYLDFGVLEDGKIEMEIMEDGGHFGIVDAAIAARVIEIAMGDERSVPLCQKLGGLPIEWLT